MKENANLDLKRYYHSFVFSMCQKLYFTRLLEAPSVLSVLFLLLSGCATFMMNKSDLMSAEV